MLNDGKEKNRNETRSRDVLDRFPKLSIISDKPRELETLHFSKEKMLFLFIFLLLIVVSSSLFLIKSPLQELCDP